MQETSWARAAAVLAPALVLLAVLVHVPWPLSGDQALFVYGAQRLSAGDRLYVEFWDNKQPGIYWFYLAGLWLFGPAPAGVHRLEALWMIGLALLTYRVVRKASVPSKAACLAPIAAVATFYAAASAWHLTQIESLVGLPLLGVAVASLLASDTPGRRTRNAALMGLGTGIVATFKLVLAIVPVGMCVLYWAWVVRSRRAPAGRATLEVLLPAAASAMLVIGTVAAVLVSGGGGREALWANLQYPLVAAREIPRAPVGRLIGSAKWLVRALLPLLPLTLVGSVPFSATGRRAQLRALMILWITLAAGAILVQKFSWWEYHLALFFVPIGVLATIGLAELAERRRSGSAGRTAFAVALVLVSLGVATTAYRLVSKRPGSDLVAAEAGRLEASVTDALGPALPGRSLYVFGDPRLLLASEGRQAIPIHGWAWELMIESQWQELPGALRRAAPEAVYVSSFYQEILCRRSPALVRWLREAYEERGPDALGGVWLLRRPASAVGTVRASGGCWSSTP